MPTMARSARDLRRPLGNDNRNSANAGGPEVGEPDADREHDGIGYQRHRPPEQPQHPDEHHQRSEAVDRAAYPEEASARHERPAGEHLEHRLEPDRALLGCADEHPQAQHARRDQECGANPSDGWRIAHERSRVDHGWTAPIVDG